MIHRDEQNEPEHEPNPSGDLNAEQAISQFQDMTDIFMFLADMSSVQHLSQADLSVLDQLVTGTYTGHVQVNTGNEYGTAREHLELPSLISHVEAISVYRDRLDDFSEGPLVSPQLLAQAVETLATLGKTVVGIYRSDDESLEHADQAKILYIPSGGQISISRDPE
jgi:hypothetical protein